MKRKEEQHFFINKLVVAKAETTGNKEMNSVFFESLTALF